MRWGTVHCTHTARTLRPYSTLHLYSAHRTYAGNCTHTVHTATIQHTAPIQHAHCTPSLTVPCCCDVITKGTRVLSSLGQTVVASAGSHTARTSRCQRQQTVLRQINHGACVFLLVPAHLRASACVCVRLCASVCVCASLPPVTWWQRACNC